METWTFLLLFGAAWIGWRILKARAEAAADRHERLLDLQLWSQNHDGDDTIDRLQVHFPSMMARHSTCMLGLEDVTIYHVRRKPDGTWERRYTHESWLDHLEYLREWRPDEVKEATNDWHAGFDSSIETAYQRFIHAPDVVPVLDYPVRWREDQVRVYARKAKEREEDKAAKAAREPYTLTAEDIAAAAAQAKKGMDR